MPRLRGFELHSRWEPLLGYVVQNLSHNGKEVTTVREMTSFSYQSKERKLRRFPYSYQFCLSFAIIFSRHLSHDTNLP